MISTGEKAKIYIELPSGEINEITGYVKTISISKDVYPVFEIGVLPVVGYSRGAETTTTLEIVGDVHWTTGKQINARKSNLEWKCDYCNTINSRENKKCSSCGANRSFIYG